MAGHISAPWLADTKAVLKRAHRPGLIPNPLVCSRLRLEAPTLCLPTRSWPAGLAALGLGGSLAHPPSHDRGRLHRAPGGLSYHCAVGARDPGGARVMADGNLCLLLFFPSAP